jgi:hypothetical protein
MRNFIKESGRPAFSDLAGMFWLALATLVFELAYNKIVVVQNYGRLGYIVIGTALLGFAVSGVLLTCSQRLQAVPSERLVPTAALLTAVSMAVAYLFTSTIPLDFTAFFVRPVLTLIFLACWYVGLTLPFFFAGLAICSLLGRGERGIGWLYGADLVGAGLGAIISIPALPLVGGAGTVWLAAVLAAAGAAFFAWRRYPRLGMLNVATGVGLAAVALLVVPRVGVIVHTPKRGFAEDRDAGRILTTRWSRISRIDVADHGDHRMIWFDGGSMQSHMFPFRGDVDDLPAALPRESSAVLPYTIRPRNHALVIASSGGKEVIWALAHGTKQVTAVELDPVVCDLVAKEFDEYLGGLFNLPTVELINQEGRSFIRRSEDKYDVIQQISAHSVTMVTTGAAAGCDSYLLTVEAFRDYWDHLTDDGVLYISRQNGIRLFTTVLAALEGMGVDPEGRIYLERGVNTYNYNALLLRKTPFPRSELEIIADHVRRNRRTIFFAPNELFDILGPNWTSDRPDPNCRAVLERIYAGEAAARDRLYGSLPFVAHPATDDRPFFNRVVPFFSRIDSEEPSLPAEMKELAEEARKFGPVPIGDVPAVAVLGEAVLMAAVVIFLPLLKLGRTSGRRSIRYLLLLYFSLLGVGFIALEVILLQRYILFVGSPTLAMAIVLGSLLVFAGLGSAFLSPLVVGRPRLGVVLFIVIGLLAYSYAIHLESLFVAWLKWDLLTRCATGVALLAPLGLLLGVPFPTGLRYASRQDERLVAWGWALNGYMTVIGTTGISIIIQFLGYRLMFLVGGAIYVLAGACFGLISHRIPQRRTAG